MIENQKVCSKVPKQMLNLNDNYVLKPLPLTSGHNVFHELCPNLPYVE